MNETPTPEAPAALAGHANYAGDRRRSVGQLMGPNTLGEVLVVVDATYDEATNRTRLGFDYARRWVR